MVGTNNMSCTSCATIASSTPCGVNEGTITWVEPDRFPANTALKSAIWNIGAECSRRPPRVRKLPVDSDPIAEASTLL
ncbi:Uncharacterised protein [Mycobacteroides abscessus subsp. abscessus]|nr:Uncharacterised protein [Mycobacteroides abscessus subsp. abscessus]SHW56562.1 Uncharacterised protein [Mycobacteroides abscessus subsp. abscessus]SKT42660.1 Uncharacterised protein [Mycobacteroides abscessus subsp. abscessus]